MQTGGVSFSFEIKLEFIGHKDAAYVQRKKGEGYNPKNIVPTAKHSGGGIIHWAASVHLELGIL